MFFRVADKGIILNIRVMPNASCCAFRGLFTGADGSEYLKTAVVSVPEKGKANKELLTFLAKQLDLSKSCMELVSGETDKYKRILVCCPEQKQKDRVLQRLKTLQEEAEHDGRDY